ncbi:MAG TPA: DUF5752 family protein [Thermodesulfovibrionales bacterium]|nr:DUF5752 family protein [Thermodesulfovibrionales bacterium]
MPEPFEFGQCIGILKATGKRARNLRELRDSIETASNESLYHHTYQYLLSGHILEYTNDFALWAGESLGERVLAEHLSNIDPYEFSNINDLRLRLLEVIDDYLVTFPEPREAMSGDEFYLQETVTLVFPIGIKANNLAEFLIAVRFIDAGSLYYHFYDARYRLGRGRDDFSAWFEALGNRELVEKIRAIDPFMHTIEGIRGHIIEAVEEAVKKDMEVIPQ